MIIICSGAGRFVPSSLHLLAPWLVTGVTQREAGVKFNINSGQNLLFEPSSVLEPYLPKGCDVKTSVAAR